ncbi:aldehyde oxidase medium subunit domain protein [Pseudomonas fluorescens]|uniref:Aldehyde oxidase medium subunit domain protein n=1 Tax=Pseudomonas fluorescens TaxID=294 RepID=A0A0P8X7B5_PSEFL|nr:aldehyde oxidase medium subunit domain protein [Pseudomonas fluorescens]
MQEFQSVVIVIVGCPPMTSIAYQVTAQTLSTIWQPGRSSLALKSLWYQHLSILTISRCVIAPPMSLLLQVPLWVWNSKVTATPFAMCASHWVEWAPNPGVPVPWSKHSLASHLPRRYFVRQLATQSMVRRLGNTMASR